MNSPALKLYFPTTEHNLYLPAAALIVFASPTICENTGFSWIVVFCRFTGKYGQAKTNILVYYTQCLVWKSVSNSPTPNVVVQVHMRPKYGTCSSNFSKYFLSLFSFFSHAALRNYENNTSTNFKNIRNFYLNSFKVSFPRMIEALKFDLILFNIDRAWWRISFVVLTSW